MQCPKCFSDLTIASSKKRVVNTCKICKGMWLSREVLEGLEKQYKRIWFGQDTLDYVLSNMAECRDTKLFCPNCESQHLRLCSAKEFEYEQCPQCQGIFLDQDEFDLMLGSRAQIVTFLGHSALRIGPLTIWWPSNKI